MEQKATEKELFWMRVSEVHDLASDILNAVRASPEGISREDIIAALPESSPDLYTEAFEIAIEEDEIIPVKLQGGVEGYRLNPEYELED